MGTSGIWAATRARHSLPTWPPFSPPSLPFRGLLFTCLCFDDVTSQLRYQTLTPGIPKVLGLLYNLFLLVKVEFISLTDQLRLKLSLLIEKINTF